MFSRESGPTDPNSVTNRRVIAYCLPYCLRATNVSPSNPSDNMTELNEQVNEIMFERIRYLQTNLGTGGFQNISCSIQ